MKFRISSPYSPSGDQPSAIRGLCEAINGGCDAVTLLGVTGSGKTMTSYKAARNLLMDIPSIDKTVFLIDRQDLDEQTTVAFQSYAENDSVDVDETDNVTDLKNKLKNNDRQMIVTTKQKLPVQECRQ